MTTLKFHPRAGQLVNLPGAGRTVGQHARYLGRTYDAKLRTYKADAKPFQCDAASKAGRRLAKRLRRGEGVWAADEATAKACGARFVKIKQDGDGEWVSAEPKPKKTKTAEAALKES